MSNLSEAILLIAHSLPEGNLLSPKEFLHLGSRDAVDQTLSRLTKEEQLLRIGRGLYAAPVRSRFGVRPPSTEAVIAALTSSSNEIIVASGAAEANVLGLTTQVPIREVYLTSGPSRLLQLGKRTVELKHASRWQLALGERPAGQVVRALAWLGQEQASTALKHLIKTLSLEEWRALHSVRASLPSWLARSISETEATHYG